MIWISLKRDIFMWRPCIHSSGKVLPMSTSFFRVDYHENKTKKASRYSDDNSFFGEGPTQIYSQSYMGGCDCVVSLFCQEVIAASCYILN